MANEMKIRITADASQATTIMKATQANINKIIKNQPGLEKAFTNDSSQKNLDAINKNLSNVIELVERAAQAIHMADPTISEAEARAKLYASTMESLGREYGGSATEAMKFLENLRDIEKATVDAEMNAKKMAVAQNSLATATKAAGTAAKTSSDYFKKLFDTTKNVLTFRVTMKVINSIAGLNNFLKDSVQVAAEAEQVFSKLNTVFGETSGAMSRAISLATKLGTATSTAASALSTVGDLLQAQGQTTLESLSTASEWVSQFQDIIAFKDINMSIEEFAQNFMSGAAGNLRNFRTFGSIVRESAVNAELAKKGLDNLTGSELELAKMTARAEMALEQQKNAIGATQREWDTMLSIQRRYEESLKSLKENVGEFLSPISKWWIEIKTNILDALNAQLKYQKLTNTLKGGGQIEQIYTLLPDENTFDWSVWKAAIKDLEALYKTSGGEATKMDYAEILGFQYGMTPEYLEKALRTANEGAANFTESFIEKVVDSFETDLRITKINENKKNEVNTAITNANNLDKFLESIMAIDNRISFVGEEWYQTFVNSLDNASKGIGTIDDLRTITRETYKKIIDSSIQEIKGMEISSFEKLFEAVSDTDLLEQQRKALENLYKIAETTGKYTNKQLEEIYNKWEELGIKIDEIKEKENIQQQIKDMWEDLFDSLKDTYAPIGVFVDGIIGSVKGAMDGISEGEGFWGKLWGGISGVFSGNAKGTLESENLEKVLMNILSKTEAFQELMSMMDTYIIPVIDQFLKPLLPLIDYFGKILQNTLLSFLEWFWPIMQGIAIGLTYIIGGINAVSQLISDSIKSLIGNVVVMFYKVIDAILWGDQSAPSWARDWADIKVWDNFQNNLKGIEDAVNDIKNNTLSIDSNVEELNEDDYETYRRLLQAKEITDEQFKRLTHQDVYTTKTVGNGIEYTSGGKKSYVSINNLTVQVPAGMTLEEFLRNIGDYNNGNLPFGINTISA